MNRRLISSGSSFEREIGYSRAVVDGEWIFVSGTTGFDISSLPLSKPGRASGMWFGSRTFSQRQKTSLNAGQSCGSTSAMCDRPP